MGNKKSKLKRQTNNESAPQSVQKLSTKTKSNTEISNIPSISEPQTIKKISSHIESIDKSEIVSNNNKKNITINDEASDKKTNLRNEIISINNQEYKILLHGFVHKIETNETIPNEIIQLIFVYMEKLQTAIDYFDSYSANAFNGGPEITLSNNNCSARCHFVLDEDSMYPTTEYHQVRGNKILKDEGNYMYAIKLEYFPVSNILIGCVSPQISINIPKLYDMKTGNIYLLSGYNMKRYGDFNYKDNWKSNGIKQLSVGMTVKMYISVNKYGKGEMKMFINDEDYGTLFKNMITPIVPVLEMSAFSGGTKISLVWNE
eukprot:139653_1